MPTVLYCVFLSYMVPDVPSPIQTLMRKGFCLWVPLVHRGPQCLFLVPNDSDLMKRAVSIGDLWTSGVTACPRVKCLWYKASLGYVVIGDHFRGKKERRQAIHLGLRPLGSIEPL